MPDRFAQQVRPLSGRSLLGLLFQNLGQANFGNAAAPGVRKVGFEQRIRVSVGGAFVIIGVRRRQLQVTHSHLAPGEWRQRVGRILASNFVQNADRLLVTVQRVGRAQHGPGPADVSVRQRKISFRYKR